MEVTKRQFLKMAAGFGLVGGFSSVAGVGYAYRWEPGNVVIEPRILRLPSLPSAFEGFKIAFMSDFHLYPFTKAETIHKAVALAHSFQPDLVLLGGDFVYGSVEAIFELAPILAGLNPKKGVFAVLGNHDHRKGARTVTRALSGSGIEVLTNRGVTLQIGSETIYLAGIDSVSAGQPSPSAAFQDRKKDVTSLVLVHEPDFIDQLIDQVPVDLQLSGHSHGGQVRLPLLGAIMLPEWGQIYNLGRYQVGQAQLYTTRGIGMIGLPIRVNCTPEVTCITLQG
jgi:predicted MPP superfamily phosphohydrolase